MYLISLIMDELTIKFYKWDKDFKKYFHSCKKYLNIYNPQFYFPILSLYIYYHNTKYSHKKIDLDRRYILKTFLILIILNIIILIQLLNQLFLIINLKYIMKSIIL